MALVKIKLRASFSGPAGVMPAGSEIETTAKEAKSLVEAGFAEYVKEPEIETATSAAVEARETTSKRTRRKRKK